MGSKLHSKKSVLAIVMILCFMMLCFTLVACNTDRTSGGGQPDNGITGGGSQSDDDSGDVTFKPVPDGNQGGNEGNDGKPSQDDEDDQTVTTPPAEVSDILLNPNTAELKESDGIEILGATQLRVNVNKVSVKAGDVLVVDNSATGIKEAFKVVSVGNAVDGLALVQVEKPQIEEVYEKFVYEGNAELSSDSDIEFLFNDDAAAASAIATAAASIFNVAPEVGGDISRNDDGSITLVLTVTLPNVVKIGSETTNLILTITDTVTAESATDINFQGLKKEYDLDLLVKNAISCNVKIESGYSYSQVTNVNEIIAKLEALSENTSSDEEGIVVPAFVWTLPIANGAASISYGANVVLRFDFAGAFNLDADADLNYNLKMSYNQNDGFSSDSSVTDDSGFKSVSLSLDGSVKVKVGLEQNLTFDIWSGYMATPSYFLNGDDTQTNVTHRGWTDTYWSDMYDAIMIDQLKVKEKCEEAGMETYAHFDAINTGASAVELVSAWGNAQTISSLVVALLMPILGSLADFAGNKIKFFLGFFLTGLVLCLAQANPMGAMPFLVVYVLCTIGLNSSMTFYDAMLPDVTTDERMDNVSSLGYAWG